MNTKVGSVIALELGILIAILAWLAFARGPGMRTQATARMQPREDSFTTVAPLFKSGNQAPDAEDSSPTAGQAQSTDNPPAATAQVYVREIVTQPDAGSLGQQDLIAGASPYYSELDEEPLLAPPDFFGPPATPFVQYFQPTSVFIVSTNRIVVNRHRPLFHCGPAGGGGPGRVIMTHRHPREGGPPVRVPSMGNPSAPPAGGTVAHRKGHAPPTQPNQGVRVSFIR